jgi:hypothetical protein
MSDIIVPILFLVGAIGILVLVLISSAKQKKRNEERQRKEIEDFTQAFTSIGEKYIASGLPEYRADFALKKDEKLYVRLAGVNWMEYRKVRTGRVSGHGFTGSITIAKGLRYRYGTGYVAAESMDQLKPIDTGDLFITSKSVIFRGSMGNKTIPLNKIMKLTPSMVGLKIERDTGKDVYIPFDFKPMPHYFTSISLLWASYEQFGTTEEVIKLT